MDCENINLAEAGSFCFNHNWGGPHFWESRYILVAMTHYYDSRNCRKWRSTRTEMAAELVAEPQELNVPPAWCQRDSEQIPNPPQPPTLLLLPASHEPHLALTHPLCYRFLLLPYVNLLWEFPMNPKETGKAVAPHESGICTWHWILEASFMCNH